jgi:hypothetical protein
LVVAATGFHVSFPFLPEGLVPMKHEQLALVYGGCVLPEYKHLYILGTQQTRYGIGPLLTPGSRLVAKMIDLQDRMELPIGLVIRESGQKPPETHLIDPMQAMRRMKIANYTLPLLLRRERRLRKKFVKPVLMDRQMTSKPDVQVY